MNDHFILMKEFYFMHETISEIKKKLKILLAKKIKVWLIVENTFFAHQIRADIRDIMSFYVHMNILRQFIGGR